MEYNRISTKTRHDKNPFLAKALEEVNVVRKMQTITPKKDGKEIQHVVVNQSTGEIDGYSSFVKFVEVDEEKFAKIFVSEFAHFWDLSKAAIRVFGYIIRVLPKDQDLFYLRMDEALSYTKYSHRNSVFSGLSDLIDNGIVARGKYENEYYINPLVMFNGSRVTFTKAFVKKKLSNDVLVENVPQSFIENS